MILDRLERAEIYRALHPHLAWAFNFLRQKELDQLAQGRVEIDGDNLYAVVLRANGKAIDQARLETHRKYIDVQYLVSGSDKMGWKDIELCSNPAGPYDPKGDAQLFEDSPNVLFTVEGGNFVVFFPHDAHAPGIGKGPFHKVVVKVLVE